MEELFNFKCAASGIEEMPLEVAEKYKFLFPEVHLNAKEMAELSKVIKEYKVEQYCKLPFCMTVEAESLGGKINLGDHKIGPRISEYAFNSIDELDNITGIDYEKNRIKEVLEAVEILTGEGQKVVLSIQGPYSIAQSLIDPKFIFKAVRKEKYKIERFLSVIEDAVVSYIMEGINRGAKIISYGDASGALDIIGPKMYRELSGRYNYNVLRRVSKDLHDGIIHVCGVTSASLHNSGFVKSTQIEIDGEMSYSEALKKAVKENSSIKIVGHNCIKRLNIKMKKNKIWIIEVN